MREPSGVDCPCLAVGECRFAIQRADYRRYPQAAPETDTGTGTTTPPAPLGQRRNFDLYAVKYRKISE